MLQSDPTPNHGVLLIDKPSGLTSHDVVIRTRRALHIKKIGHIGTLDPLATGILPLVIGRATRLATFLSIAPKIYEAVIRLGASTDTFDRTGVFQQSTSKVIMGLESRTGPSVDRHSVENVLNKFTGSFSQTPPPFSAKKIEGQRAYKLARQGRPITPEPVNVHVERLDLLEFTGDLLRIRLVCSPGFYVRSLANDIGQALGSGAYLEALRRERSGEFGLETAVSISEIQQQGVAALAQIIPLSKLLQHLPSVTLTLRGQTRAAHGNLLLERDISNGTGSILNRSTSGVVDSTTWIRLLSQDGSLIALAQPKPRGLLHPTVVLV